ncbi:MAG: hypothetical protein EOO39_48415, partial [Cytophagaceae bacterium]
MPEQPKSTSRQLQSYGVSAAAVIMVVSILWSQGLSWSIYIIPLLILAAGIVYYLSKQQNGAPWSKEARLYRQLVERCRGDRE